MNIFILYTIYYVYTTYILRFSIKEKLNILLSNIYLKKEKKTCFKLKFLKRCWYRVIQWFLSIVQAKYYFPRQISIQRVSFCRGHDTFSWEILAYIEKRFELGSCTKSRTKISQNKVSPSLFSPSSAVSFSLLISFTISGLLELGRYATYNQQTSFLNETSCRTYIFWKEKGASLFSW